MSVYRGDRDRFEDSRTSVSTSRRDRDGGYTTVKRYVVKDDDNRSSYGGRDRRYSDRPAERVEETRIVRREVEEAPPPRREEPRYAERELVIRRDRSEDPPRRNDWDYGRRRDDVETDRELVIRRTTERDEPRRDERDLTVARFDERRDYRDARYGYDMLSPTRGGFDDRDRDLQRYTRTAEYFSPPQQPQTIIIKQEPIIIRERVRDDDYQIVKRSDAEDERSVVKRDDRSRGREEEYFYEKKVKERVDEPRRDDREDDFYERKSMRREVSPGDSVSQVGRRDRSRGRDYSSDDSMVYVRKETREVSDDEGDPHHRKHLAEGVIAGIGAAELLRNHKKKEGRETGGGLNRIGKDLGAGALGALAAEGISRARSAHRSRSRRRERSGSRETRRDKKSNRSRSRKRGSSSEHSSRERLKTLGKYGLGAAALAAAAAFAKSRMDKNKEEDAGGDRRSRSQTRHGSSDDNTVTDDARNPSHRNKRMAEAGAAGAIVAGLVERARSKSRGPREGSQNRLKQAIPVIAAGLGSAALAGVYEKKKAAKQTEEAEKDKRRARSRQRSRSRAREAGMYPDGPPNPAAAMSDPGLIEYGQGNIYGNNYGADYYGRPQPQDGYYNDQTAVVPAAAAGAGYGAQRELRSRSGSRRRSSSRSSSSDGGRRRRRHNRDQEAAAASAAGLGGAAAASEYERKKAEKRERKARKRAAEAQQQEYAPYDGTYQPPHQPYTPPPPVDPYASQSGFYPQSSQFPPPPGQQYAAPHQPSTASGPFAPGTTYDPTSFPPPPTGVPPQTAPAPQYGDAYASGANQNPYAPRGRGADENVSVAPPPTTAFGSVPFQAPPMNDYSSNERPHSVPDGLNNAPQAPPPPPAISLQPPSVSGASSSYRPPDQTIYTPPSDRSPRSTSVPPPNNGGARKSVQFAATPAVAPAELANDAQSNTEQPRRHHRSHRERGYEAGEDTDSPDDVRRRTEPNVAAARSAEAEPVDTRRSRHHTRRRSHEPTASSGLVPDPGRPSRDLATSPASDATEELPPRFDKKGRKKPEAGDPNDVLAGLMNSRPVNKLFGNFVDGLFGPEGRGGGK